MMWRFLVFLPFILLLQTTKVSLSRPSNQYTPDSPWYVSVGCWKDSLPRAIAEYEWMFHPNDHYKSREKPIQKCFEAALRRGHMIFAVQDGGQCFSPTPPWNGESDESFKMYGPSSDCLEDGTGGAMANSVYEIKFDACFETNTETYSFGPANSSLLEFSNWRDKTGYRRQNVSSTIECQKICQNKQSCNFFTYWQVFKWCDLITSPDYKNCAMRRVSGPKYCNSETSCEDYDTEICKERCGEVCKESDDNKIMFTRNCDECFARSLCKKTCRFCN